MPTPFIPLADIERVFEAWRVRQARPQVCRMLADRKDLLRKRLALGYSPDDLIAVIEYIYEADEPDPKWMRGQNPRHRAYLGLDNILRREPLAGRVEAALVWKESKSGATEHEDADPWKIV